MLVRIIRIVKINRIYWSSSIKINNWKYRFCPLTRFRFGVQAIPSLETKSIFFIFDKLPKHINLVKHVIWEISLFLLFNDYLLAYWGDITQGRLSNGNSLHVIQTWQGYNTWNSTVTSKFNHNVSGSNFCWGHMRRRHI